MEEIWKDIKGYEGLYQVSNKGNIKSLDRTTGIKKHGIHRLKEKILKPIKCGKYYQIYLCKDNKAKSFYIHRLVGENFIDNIKCYTDINHKDGNTHNNNVENLEWCTRSYNIEHSYKVLKRKVNVNGLIEYREKHKRKVNQYDLDDNFIKQWNYIKEAENFLNIKSIGKISECCNNKRKSAFGYKWKYAENTQIPQ